MNAIEAQGLARINNAKVQAAVQHTQVAAVQGAQKIHQSTQQHSQKLQQMKEQQSLQNKTK
jgi:hypothetical protein